MPTEPTLTFPPDGSVTCRFWADECVAYHELSGETHLITEVGALLFKSILKHPLKRSQLVAELTTAFEFPAQFDLEAYLDKLTHDYQTLGLLVVTEHQQL